MRLERTPSSRRYRWLVQFAVGTAALAITFDLGSVNVALHVIAQSFGVGTAFVSWLMLLNFLVVSSTLLAFGRLADIIGNKAVFASGFGVFAVGALGSGLAPNFQLLLLFRGIQSVGISMVSSISSSILVESTPIGERGVVLGINSTVVGVGSFLGPIVGGFLVESLGWRYAFLMSVPFSLMGLVTALAVLPRGLRRGPIKADTGGIMLFALTAATLLLALNQIKTLGWHSPTVISLLGASLLSLAVFCLVERRTPEPMVDLGLFSNRLFSLSLFSAFLLFVGTSIQNLLLPLFIQGVMLLSPATAGLVTSIVAVVRVPLSSPSGWLSDRIGTRTPAVLGAAIAALGILGLSLLDGSTLVSQLVWLSVIIGVGSAVFIPGNMTSTISSVPPARLGTASSAIGLRRNLGQAVGVALGAALVPTTTGQMASLVLNFQIAFLLGALVTGAAALASLVGGSIPPVKKRLSP